jgi:hypothetical protein
MELIFDVILFIVISANIGISFSMMGMIDKILHENRDMKNRFEPSQNIIKQDIDLIEVHIAKLSLQMDALPDIIRQENYRTLLAFKESSEPAKPIKPNNWDSMREAFTSQAKAKEDVRD